MTHIATPRPWPEAQMPTPEQWRAWFLACTPDEQLHLAVKVLDDNERATRCLLADHEILMAERMDVQATLAARRYRLAWLSARRRGRAAAIIRNHLRDRGLWPEDGGR